MNILHINANYPFSSLYGQMMSHISVGLGDKHFVYVPMAVEHSKTIGTLAKEDPRVIYSSDYRLADRWRYSAKRAKILEAVMRQVEVAKIDLVHAHHLFTAGGVAYELKKRYGTPYITAVRNTDINSFFRFAIHLRSIGHSILREASNVVFISPAGMSGTRSYVSESAWKKIAEKSLILPNGVDDFWLVNMPESPYRLPGQQIQLLFVGQVCRNKNVGTIIAAADELERRGYSSRLLLVGDGPDLDRIRAMAGRSKATVQLLGRIDSRVELMTLYRASDVFIMPSITETFGLVYVEAMSQGLPIIYSRGQGVDGFFSDGDVGFSCRSRDARGIADAVCRIRSEYSAISSRCIEAAKRFAWSSIVRDYEAMYRSAVK